VVTLLWASRTPASAVPGTIKMLMYGSHGN
jgi:hypothetical protein